MKKQCNNARIIKKYNKTKYSYTEGINVEKDIFEYIKKYDENDYHKIFEKDDRWTVFYHLTDIRKGIISWYPFDKKKDCLEIGGGMGSMTGFLCQKCHTVTTVEMSELRANALYERHKNIGNLEIYVGDLNDIIFDKKFDYITLIGVLEYQGRYSKKENPYVEFLKKVKSLLKPNGKLIIAIENRFGLKYWSGCPEDHTAIPFDGINNYKLSQSARTFSKNDLSDIIKKSGFKNQKFYYPLPDYKLPQVIYSQEYLPRINIKNRYRQYFLDYRSLVLDENNLLLDIIDNNVFEFFANSFLVECSDGDLAEVLFSSITGDRRREIQLTTVVEKNRVKKIPLNNNAIDDINNSYYNICDLEKKGIKVIKHKIKNNELIMPYINESCLDEKLLTLAKYNEFEKFYKLIDNFYNELLKTSKITQNNILIEKKIADNKYDFGPVLEIGYTDFLFHNCFVIDNIIYVFDQEFIEKNVPANFMLFRSFKNLYYGNSWLEEKIPIRLLKQKYNLEKVWQFYEKLDCILLSQLKYKGVNDILVKHWNYDVDILEKNQELLLKSNKYVDIVNENKILKSNFNSISNSNEELNKINKKLSKSNEKLNTINIKLSNSNEELNKININLSNSNEELNKINIELTKANEELNRINQQLAEKIQKKSQKKWIFKKFKRN